MGKKIAFLFLTMRGSECDFIWDDFFLNVDKNKYCIFCHPKYPDEVHDFLRPHIIPEHVETEWGEPSLVKATFLLYKNALLDPDVSHFILLSHDSVPVRDFNKIYTELGENPGRNYLKTAIHGTDQKLYNRNRYHWQWVILSRDFVKMALEKSHLIFLYYDLYAKQMQNSHPFTLDEHWVFILVNRILNKEISHFFIDTNNCKTYKQRMFIRKLKNKKRYYRYFSRYYHDEKSIQRFRSIYSVTPRIYNIQEYFGVKNEMEKNGYFFMRKVIGVKKEYEQLKASQGF